MAQQYKGSCLCGQVTYELEGDFDQFFFCHCSHCRKGTGSAHGANLFSHQAQLRWVTGEDRVKQFNLAGTRHTRAFCQECGSAMPIAQPNSQFVVVPAGSLDCDVNTQPTAHIFCGSRANWDAELNQVTEFSEFPS